MDRWLRFFTERFPIVNSVALVAGISLSGIYLSGRSFRFLPFLMSFIGIVFVLALMRLMDDVKNLEKDKIAHSNRPLPKGLIKKTEAILVIETMQVILFFYSLLLWVLLSGTAALSYLVIVIYFWLMYKDFGVKRWLIRHPLFYGLLNQFIILPIAFFAVAALHPSTVFTPSILAFAFMLFGAFFCNEICHKLNPQIHPVVGTYIHFYGFKFAYNIAALTLIISAMGAIYLGVAYFLIPVEALVLAALSVLFFQPLLFRMPEMIASLSLMLHAWAVVIHQALLLVT